MRLINRRPDRVTSWLLPSLPFLIGLAIYLLTSESRHASNPSDKLLPSFTQMGAALRELALEPDLRTGDYLFWTDTAASLERLGLGLLISTVLSFVVGIATGILPILSRLLGGFIAVSSMIPPLAVLPIIFIVAGLGETSKIVLIVIGTAPYLTRDMMQQVRELPREQLIKAQTLGANSWGVVVRVVAPQMLPRLIDGLRLSLGSAWLFLISAEAIASESGLGYRIFLVRRYFAMDVILPYVAWITLLAFLLDGGLAFLQRRAFPWFRPAVQA